MIVRTLLLWLCLAHTTESQNLDALRTTMRQALEHERAGRLDRAAELYVSLSAQHPGRADLTYRLADLYKRMGRHQDALDALDARIVRFPTDPRARIHRADILISAGRKKEALRTIDQALRKARSPGLFINVADTYRKQGLDDLAERAYLAARESLGDTTLFQRELAEIALARGDHLAAVREYAGFAATKPQYAGLVERQLEEIATEADDPRAIVDLLADRVQRNPTPHQIRLYVAFVLKTGHALEAVDLLAALPRRVPIAGSLLTLGRQSLEAGDHPTAVVALDSLEHRATHDGIRIQARLLRARALENLGLDTRADQLYREVVASPNGGRLGEEGAYRWARLLARTGRPDSARHVLERMILTARHGTWRGPALFDLSDLHVSAGRLPDAERVLATVAREQRGNDGEASALFKQAEIDFMRLRFEAASEGLRTVLSTNRTYRAINDAIALSHLLQIGTSQDTVALRELALSLRAERQGDLEHALAALKTEATPTSPLGDHILRRRIELLQLSGRSDETIETCQTLVDRFPWSPFSPWALLVAGDTYRERPEHVGSALEMYERLLIDYGRSIEADEARMRIKTLRPAQTGGQPG
ncbi:MAG: hypothetical protein CME26_04140 [Gemmatimonadetes bacterium]|nr:hypothetical protein [Gemmatimonadota bacterium]